MNDPVPARRLRQYLTAFAALTCAGVLVELVVTGHTEFVTQWIPIVLCALGTVVFGLNVLRPSRASVPVAGLVAIALSAGGALGVYEHLIGNLNFAREVRAAEAAAAPLLAAITGANPPFAPGALALAGAAAWAGAWKSPRD